MDTSFFGAMFSFKPLVQFAIAILGAIGIWLTAAVQAVDDKAKLASGDEAKKLLATLSEASRKDVEQPDYVQALRRMSVVQLRQAVADYAREMRLFQNELDRQMVTQQMFPASRVPLSPEEQAKRFQDEAQAMLNRRQANNYKFRNEVRPKALALREEITRRTGVPVAPGSNLHAYAVLDFGELVGAHPVSVVADYLEEIARQL